MKALRQPLTSAPTPVITRRPHLVLQRAMSEASSLEKREAFATARVDEALDSPGQPLDATTRAEMEPRLGHDFANVRVHADSRASDSARAVNATAYTVGRELVFRVGHYRPETEVGKRLLAHELTHVVQQGAANPRLKRNTLDSEPVVSQPSDRAEQEADRGAEAVASGESFAPSMKATPDAVEATIQRADEEWNKAYGTHKSFLQKPFEEFKAGLGEVKSTTQGGLTENKGRPLAERQKGAPTGTPAAPEISFDTLKEIYAGLKADVTSDPAKEAKAKKYLEHLNKAFKISSAPTSRKR